MQAWGIITGVAMALAVAAGLYLMLGSQLPASGPITASGPVVMRGYVMAVVGDYLECVNVTVPGSNETLPHCRPVKSETVYSFMEANSSRVFRLVGFENATVRARDVVGTGKLVYVVGYVEGDVLRVVEVYE